MKKVGILTLTGNDNFGNKLQNFAVVKYLKKMNVNPETIWVTNPFKDSNIKQLLRFFKAKIVNHINRRNNKFLKFNKNLNFKKTIIFNNDIVRIQKNYDLLIVGSDQVWNPNFFDNELIYFLSKSKKDKNISFSASFGIDSISDELVKKYKIGLDNFNYISVREEKGKEIIERITGRKDATVLVDPTMLLNKEEWDNVSRKPKQLKKLDNKKYILNYFLGNLSDKKRAEIERIANENDCKIINILNKKDPFYSCGPSEFLYLEKNAFLICTDSFHSSVFAFLYNKPFIIFDRDDNNEKMNSRLDTLINKFGLKNRRYNGKNITKENLEHDYSEAYKILEEEREKSKLFLEKALDIKK